MLIVIGLFALYRIRETLLVFVIAILFAYLLYPLMDLISRRFPSKNRTPALAVTFLLVLACLGSLLGFIGSVVVDQASNLAASAPAFISRMQEDRNPPAPPNRCATGWRVCSKISSASITTTSCRSFRASACEFSPLREI